MFDNIRLFAAIASTGRTGSSFLQRILSRYSPIVASFHDGMHLRVSKNLPTFRECINNYFSHIVTERPGCSAYIDCNPAFLESLAGAYNLGSARAVVEEIVNETQIPIRVLWMVRDPRGYVRSLKTRPWKWKWDDAAYFEIVYGLDQYEWSRLNDFERICFGWVVKNRFFRTLTGLDNCMFLRFEELFVLPTTDEEFLQKIQDLHKFLCIPLVSRIEELLVKRFVRTKASKPDAAELTPRELDIVREICGLEASIYGYEL